MSLKHGLLGLLNYGSMTGYELDKAFKCVLLARKVEPDIP